MPIAYNRLPAIAAKAPGEVGKALAKTAFAVEARAKMNAPYRTGNLRGSIQATSASALRWRVTAQAGYAIYVELGTRKMSAQPYLVPALREVWPRFIEWLNLV